MGEPQGALGNAIRTHRKQENMTLLDLAERAKISKSTLAALGRGNGTVKSLLAILEGLNLKVVGLPVGNSLGARIAVRRRSRKLSQRDLAERAGISHPTVINLETRSRGHLNSLLRVCEVLRVRLILRAGRSHFGRGHDQCLEHRP